MNIKLEITENNIWIPQEYAEIRELKNMDKPNRNGLRAYINQNGIGGNHSVRIQIRTHKGIGNFGAGKPRDMIANITLNVQELEALLKAIKELR